MVVLQDFSIGLALQFNAQQANSAAQQSSQIFTDLQTRLGQVAGSVPILGQAFNQTGQQVQAASQSIGTSFAGAGQQVQTTAQQMKTSIDTTTQSFTTFDSAGRAAGTGIGTLTQAFTATVAPIQSSGNALANNATQLTAHDAQLKANNTSMTSMSQTMTTTVLGISTLMNSVINLGTGIRDWSDANIAVEAAQRKVSLATEAQGKAQEKLDKLTREGKQGSEDYKKAQLDVSQAQQQVSIMTQRLGERQEDLFDSQLRFATSIVPTVLSGWVTIQSTIKAVEESGISLGTTFAGLGSKIAAGFSNLPSLLSSVAGQITIIGAGIALAVATIASMLQYQQQMKSLGDLAKNPNVNWQEFGQGLGQAKQNLQANPITNLLGQGGDISDIGKLQSLSASIQSWGTDADKLMLQVVNNPNFDAAAEKYITDRIETIKRIISDKQKTVNFLDTDTESGAPTLNLDKYHFSVAKIGEIYDEIGTKIKSATGSVDNNTQSLNYNQGAHERMVQMWGVGGSILVPYSKAFGDNTNALVDNNGQVVTNYANVNKLYEGFKKQYQTVQENTKGFTTLSEAHKNEMEIVIGINQYLDQGTEKRKLEAASITAVRQALASHNEYLKNSEDLGISLVDTIEKQRAAYQEQEIGLGALADKYGILSDSMIAKITNDKEDIASIQEEIAANLDYSAALTDTKTNTDLVAQGHLDGALALRKFFDGLVSNEAQMEKERAGLEAVYTKVTGLTDAYKLTIPQLKEQIQLKTNEALAHEKAIEQYQKTVAEQQKMSAAIVDLNNQYQMHLNPNMLITQKQLGDLTKAVQDYQAALDTIKGTMDDIQGFDIKKFKIDFEVEETYKDFLKNLDKDTKKDIELTVRSKAANEAAEKVLAAFAGTTLYIDAQANVDFKSDETKVDDYINTMVTTLQDKFKQKGQDPQINAGVNSVLQEMLKIAKEPDSWNKLVEFWKRPDVLAKLGTMPEASAAILKGVTAAVPTEAQMKPLGVVMAKGFVAGLKGGIEAEIMNMEIDFSNIASKARTEQTDPFDPGLRKGKIPTEGVGGDKGGGVKIPIQPDMTNFQPLLDAAILTVQQQYSGAAGVTGAGKGFMLPVTVDVATLTASLTSVTDAWTKMSTDIITIQEAMVQALVGLYTETLYGQGIAPMLLTAAGSFADYESQITEQEGSMIVAVVGLYGTLLEQIAEALAAIIGSFGEYEAAILSQESSNIQGLVSLYLEWYKDIGATLVSTAASFKDYEQAIFGTEETNVENIITEYESMTDQITQVLADIGKEFESAAEEWLTTVEDTVESIITEFETIPDQVSQVVDDINSEIDGITKSITVKVNYDTSGKPKGQFGLDFYTAAQTGTDITTKRGQPQMILVGEGPNIERVRVSRQGEPGFYDEDRNKGGGSSTIVLNAEITVVASDGSYMGKGKLRRVFPNLESH